MITRICPLAAQRVVDRIPYAKRDAICLTISRDICTLFNERRRDQMETFKTIIIYILTALISFTAGAITIILGILACLGMSKKEEDKKVRNVSKHRGYYI